MSALAASDNPGHSQAVRAQLRLREMILAEELECRKKALAKLLPMQRQDFVEIFKITNNKKVENARQH